MVIFITVYGILTVCLQVTLLYWCFMAILDERKERKYAMRRYELWYSDKSQRDIVTHRVKNSL